MRSMRVILALVLLGVFATLVLGGGDDGGGGGGSPDPPPPVAYTDDTAVDNGSVTVRRAPHPAPVLALSDAHVFYVLWWFSLVLMFFWKDDEFPFFSLSQKFLFLYRIARVFLLCARPVCVSSRRDQGSDSQRLRLLRFGAHLRQSSSSSLVPPLPPASRPSCALSRTIETTLRGRTSTI